jgi:NADH-quinone oxidoreductase subunit J
MFMVTLMQILFILLAAFTLGCALLVVTAPNMVHSSLWLVATLFGVAVTFAVLQAGFLAVVQVVVYIGAIAVLIIFAIMLTRRLAQDPGPRFNENWLWAVVISLFFFILLSFMFANTAAAHIPLTPLDARANTLQLLGIALVAPEGYVLPFELASILLLASLIGAIVIAWEKK